MATEGTTSSATSPSQHPEPPKKLSDKDFNFHYDRILGEGSFSTVMVGTERRSGVQWAIKSLVIKQLLRDNMQEYAFRERDALNLLNTRPWDPSTLAKSDKSDPADITEDLDPSSKREGAAQTPTKSRKMEPHPFFVRLHASFKSHERLFYVLTYARNGEILDYVKRMGSLPLHVARFYLAEIVSAVHHLHRYGIIHRDLKPENILLGDAMHILLTDFGSCKILKSTSTNATTSAASNESRVSTSRQPEAGSPPRPIYGPVPPPNHPATYIAARGAAQAGRGMRRRANSFVGTAQYVSPEMLQGRPEEKASDLWALGCILYHFIAGSFPFKGTSQYHIFQKIQALDFDYPEEFDEVAKDLTSKLIVLDPEKRLGADASGGISALVRHPFLADVDFETLHLQKAPLSPTDRLAAGAAASESSGTEDPNLEDGFNEEDFARAVMLKLDDDDDETFLSDGDQNGKNESPSAAPANGAIPIPTRGKSCVIPASQSSSAVSNGSVPVNHPYSSSSSSACASPSSVSSSAENKQLANYLAPESMTGSGSFSRLPSTTAWTAVSMKPIINDLLDMTEEDRAVERQKQADHDFRPFVEGNLILKTGILEKKRHAHYPTRRRMFLLTEGPHLYYVDPDKKELKGEVPWSVDMKTKFQNFKKFEIQTPNRTYDLVDSSGGAIDWCQCLDAVRDRYFPPTLHETNGLAN